jgi:hypothetical protein
LVTLRPRLPKDPVERIWKTLTDKLESKGLQRYPNETSLQWLNRVRGDLPADQQVLFASICKEYNHLRYEVQSVKSKDVRNLRVLAAKLKP